MTAANTSSATTVTTSLFLLDSLASIRSPRPELDVRPLKVAGNDNMPALKLSASATDVAHDGTKPTRAATTGCHRPGLESAP